MALKKNKNKNLNTASNLKISVKKERAEYTFFLNGRLDTLTSPDLDIKVKEVLDDAKKLIFDLENLEYISSAGLRVLLGAAQNMEGKGDMVVCNVTRAVQDIFDLTGFNLVFNIK